MSDVDYEQVRKLKSTNPPCEGCNEEKAADGYFLDTDNKYHAVGRRCWNKYQHEIGKSFKAGGMW